MRLEYIESSTRSANEFPNALIAGQSRKSLSYKNSSSFVPKRSKRFRASWSILTIHPGLLSNSTPSIRLPLARIFHSGAEQRSGGGVRRLDITQPNENAPHRFFC